MMLYPNSLLRFISYFIKKQWWYFLIIQILAFAWSIDNTFWPFILKTFIDKMNTFSGEANTLWIYLMPILILAAITWVLIGIAFRTYGFMMARVFPRFEAQIRMAMFAYVQDHSYDYFANHFAGNLSNRISDMTQSATRIMQLVITLFLPVSLAVVIASTMFYIISPWFALILVAWAIFHIGICLLSAKRCANLSETHSNARSFLTGKIVDSLTNIINIKLFARKQYECDYIYQYQQDEKQKYSTAMSMAEKIKVFLDISSFLFPGVLMTWYMLYSWQHQLISLGDFVLIFNTSWNIQHLIWFAGQELPNLYKEIGTCQQAMSLIREPHEIRDHRNANPFKIYKGQIQFNNVNFHYKQGKPVFTNLNITIEAGSKVGLVGFSGSGKSTFVNLMMRFFKLHSGTISIDQTNIEDITLESLRSQISMIPQDPSLFHRTLWENIRYGDINASDNHITSAAKHAHCHDFITELPDSYHSLVGERGIKLSGGQRQRIAIARAILENAPILILDEATSALDSVTEKRIQDALHYLMEGRTTIVIAHRLSTLAEMDRILVFDKGVIIEDGTHEQLLHANGHYATMWTMQAGGFLPDQQLSR